MVLLSPRPARQIVAGGHRVGCATITRQELDHLLVGIISYTRQRAPRSIALLYGALATVSLLTGACRLQSASRGDAGRVADRGHVPACVVRAPNELAARGDAGCVVKLGGRVLVVRHAASGKLTIPGGHSRPRESAQCTAHRETWEEAGVNVEVGRLLARLDNGFHLFECHVPVAERARWLRLVDAGVACPTPREISGVLVVDGSALTAETYRFPRYLRQVQLALGDRRRQADRPATRALQ